MALWSKWVTSSISLLKVCIALGSEGFLSGKEVFIKGRVGIVLGYEFRYFAVGGEFEYLYEAEPQFRCVYVRGG